MPPSPSAPSHNASALPVPVAAWLARLHPLPAGAALVAALIAVPILVVAASVLSPSTETWRHLVQTVLAEYVVNTLWLLPLMRKHMPYDPQRDFVPIIMAARGVNILVVHPSLPVQSVKDLIALSRKRPGELNFSTAAPGRLR